ncbi:MAG: hypothetical protein O2967_02580 [Proteobacteria bacterium]|nr:hypothetical protein [Pseudomonadota bacterium]
MLIFGDVRIDHRFDWLLDSVVATSSVVLRRLGKDRAGEITAQRFLDNERVSAGVIVAAPASDDFRVGRFQDASDTFAEPGRAGDEAAAAPER